MSTPSHQASQSYLGFAYQALYALILLLDADDQESVSVETADDVVLEGSTPCLYQLKHSVAAPPPLTIANVGWWKTLAIWAGTADLASTDFVFATCASVASGSVLEMLTTADGDRGTVRDALCTEASRVIAERTAAADSGATNLPHKLRASGCKAYLGLSPADRLTLVKRITLKPESYNAGAVSDEVDKRLRNYLLPHVRERARERLIEWWDRRITLALLGRSPRTVHKGELQMKLQEIVVSITPEELSDDFSDLEPDDYSAVIGRNMKHQIEWVQGGRSRLERAARARWQALEQRQKWIDDSIAVAPLLLAFDDRLRSLWKGRHGPLNDDCCGLSDDEKCRKGRELLDWSHHNACFECSPPRGRHQIACVVQGTFQELADRLEVGWHPEFAPSTDEPNEGRSQ